MSRKKSLGAILLIGVFLSLPFFSKAPSAIPHESPKVVKLIFVGDIMLSRQIGTHIARQGPDFPFALVNERLRQAHITFGNLEGPISDKGRNLGGVFSFRADPLVLLGLERAGFDVLSLANNHMFDWGEEAFVDTLIRVKARGIFAVGAGINEKEAHEPALIHQGSETIAFLGYSEFAFKRPSEAPTMATLDPVLIKADIHRTKEKASFIIISLHWGEEYETESSLSQKTLARSLIDAGADLVIGHHPHVVQEVERYGGGLIAYSLGNFVFDQNFSADTRRGLMLEVDVVDGDIHDFEKVPLGFNDEFQPFVL